MTHWLLRRFGVSESLAGDLEEEYRSGRSHWWLWRQSLLAIVMTNARVLWTHKLLAARAVLIGAAVTYGCLLLLALPNLARIYPFNGSPASGLRFAFLAAIGIASQAVPYWIAGWTIARLHREQQSAMVLFYAAALALEGLLVFLVLLRGVPLPLYGALRAFLPPIFVLAGGLRRQATA